jgi:hypothetical protein
MYTLNAPSGTVPITPAESQTACNAGFVITSIAGSYVGTPNTSYYLDLVINSSSTSSEATWNNAGVAIIAY